MSQSSKRPPYVDYGRKDQSFGGMTVNPRADGRYQSMPVQSSMHANPPPMPDYVAKKSDKSKGTILDPSMAKMGPALANVKVAVPAPKPDSKPVPKPAPKPAPAASTPVSTLAPSVPTLAPPAPTPVSTLAPPALTPVLTPVSTLAPSAPTPVLAPAPILAALAPTIMAPATTAPDVSAVKISSLAHYNITGGKGWQRSFGYVRGTEVQPIQMIRPGTLCSISLSHSGLGSVPLGSLFICKNRNGNTAVPTEADSSVIGIIRIKNELNQATDFILTPNESIDNAAWESRTARVEAKDRLSLYAENLSGMNLELYVEYH